MKTPFQRNGVRYFTNEHGERVCIGSQMGRLDSIPQDAAAVRKLQLRRVPMVDGCYDQGGAYWGAGTPLYCAWGESETEQAEIFRRAKDRDDAKRQVIAVFPNAKFYR